MTLPRPSRGTLHVDIYEDTGHGEFDVLAHVEVTPEMMQTAGAEVTLEVKLDHDWSLSCEVVTGDRRAPVDVLAPEAALMQKSQRPDSWDVARSDDRRPVEVGVSVRFRGEGEFTPMSTENLSRHGMFVRSSSPTPTGERVEVVLDHGGNPVVLVGHIVHVRRQANDDGGPGFGVRFDGVGPESRRAYDSLLADIEAGGLGTLVEDPKPGADWLRVFYEGVRNKDYYGALGVNPLATSAEIKVRIGELHEFFDNMQRSVSRQSAFHLKTATRVLDRMSHVLFDPRQRLTHDLEKGYVLADERLARSGESGIFDFTLLREAWHRAPGQRQRGGDGARARAEGGVRRRLRAGRGTRA